MNHSTNLHHQTIAHDFLTFGNDGIGLNRAAELRAGYRANRHPAAPNRSRPFLALRRLSGHVLIAAGTTLAGAVPAPMAAPDGHETGL